MNSTEQTTHSNAETATGVDATQSRAKTPLDAAQKIVSELGYLSSGDQLLAIRFAVETLHLSYPTQASSVYQSVPSDQATEHRRDDRRSQLDIKTFTESKSPQSDQQFAAVVAYYYQLEAPAHDRRETIGAETMKEAARLAGRPQVERWGMTLTNAKNAGYLNAVGPGEFKLSPVGENLVAISLPGGVPTRKLPKANGKKKTAQKKTAPKKPAPKKPAPKKPAPKKPAPKKKKGQGK